MQGAFIFRGHPQMKFLATPMASSNQECTLTNQTETMPWKCLFVKKIQLFLMKCWINLCQALRRNFDVRINIKYFHTPFVFKQNLRKIYFLLSKQPMLSVVFTCVPSAPLCINRLIVIVKIEESKDFLSIIHNLKIAGSIS